MDKGRYRVIKLIFKNFLGVLGLVFGGYGLYVVNEINNNIDTASTAIATNANTLTAIATNANTLMANAKLKSIQSIFVGPGKTTIAGEFASDIQGCWYYQATYVNLHPYTVLWEKSSKETKDLKIRVIADESLWDARKCIEERKDPKKEEDSKDNPKIVKLIGKESITHRIEVLFPKEIEYKYIATSRASYDSVLWFDEKGRITHRKIKAGNYKCTLAREFLVEIDCKPEASQDNENKHINEIEITELINEKENKEKYGSVYGEAINFYLQERKGLHENLVKQGCGAVPMEPEFTNEAGDLEKPSIIFLCHKNNKPSHARVMIRQEPK